MYIRAVSSCCHGGITKTEFSIYGKTIDIKVILNVGKKISNKVKQKS